jgi:stage V sporulation protein D (sporulation-specific penicillin-binding protein)
MRSPQNRPLKRRLEVVFILLLACFLALACRLSGIQGIRQSHYAQLADQMQVRRSPAPHQRGVIRDTRGRELAANIQGADITANPRVVAEPDRAVQAVLQLCKGDPEFYQKRLQSDKPAPERRVFAYLVRGVEREKAQQLEAQQIPGLEIRSAPRRIHPWGALAAHVLGYTDTDGRGLEGIELAQDAVLRGRDGYSLAEVDATGRPIPNKEREVVRPVDGKDVMLTLDAVIQQYAEDALEKVIQEEKPESATAIVMDVVTGHILAMANRPTYDPQTRGEVPVENRRNRAVTDLYEPGSTFKTITAAAMLEEKLPTSVYCPGSMGVGRRTIRCAHGSSHGKEDLLGVIQHSCNVGAATWGARLGSERLYKYVKRFGYFEPTGVELRGEAVLGLAKPKTWAAIKTANVAFGQGVVANKLQMLRFYAAVANDGILPAPTILKSVGGAPTAPKREPRRVMSAATAAKLREGLTMAVNQGTGKLAKIANYSVAGKTGTAQLARNRRYVPGAYISSFVGFLPATSPRIGIIVTVTWPKVHQYGGTVAGPVFREIARQTVNYLELPPDAPGDVRDGARPGSYAAWQRHGSEPATRVAGSFQTIVGPGSEMVNTDE